MASDRTRREILFVGTSKMPRPKIHSLYETHLFVESLERSIEFYRDVLGLQHCHTEKERRAAFFWIGEDRRSMLGVWERPKDEIEIRHFAFRVEPQAVLDSVLWLMEAGLQPYNFSKKRIQSPWCLRGFQRWRFIFETLMDTA